LLAATVAEEVDQVLVLNADSTSFLHGMVNPGAIGMSGHSFGGHTTLMVAGATIGTSAQTVLHEPPDRIKARHEHDGLSRPLPRRGEAGEEGDSR
jgi:hypothetical protein